MNPHVAAHAHEIDAAFMEMATRDETQGGEKPTVAHLTGTYFQLSQNWIHTQIKYLQDWTPVVLAHSTANLDTVEWTPEYFSRCDHLPYVLRMIDGALKRFLGVHPSHYFAACQYSVNVLHAHFGYRGWQALSLKRLLDVPLVTTFYGYDVVHLPQKMPKWAERYPTLFEEGDKFLVEGPHMGKQLEEQGCPADKIEVHPLGIETERYPYQPRQREEGEPLRILMAGRFVEKKGFPDGLRAFSQFLERGGDGVLTVIGDANDSEPSQSVKRELFRIVEEQKIAERVEFRGFVSKEELRETYYQHHVLLSPSREASSGDNEGGAPVTLIEAQATGMPVVSTYHCDIPEVVRDGDTGYLVPEGNINAIANALSEGSKPKWIKKAGWCAGEHVRAEYAAPECCRKKEHTYEKLIK